METEIVKIPLVYFDTNHIVEMIHWRKGECKAPAERIPAYAAISKAVTGGRVRLLFSSPSCLEWVEGQEDSKHGHELVEFFQTAKLDRLEVEAGLAFTLELIEETRRHFPQLSLPQVGIIRPILEVTPDFIALAKHHPQWQSIPDLKTIESPGWKPGIHECAAGSALFSKNRTASMKERKDGWHESLMATRTHFLETGGKGMKQSAKMEWANRAHFLAAILSSSDPAIDQTQLATLIDFAKCPACLLYLDALWLYATRLSHEGPKENDADDWGQIPAIAYADYALIEKKLRHDLVAHLPKNTPRAELLQGRVFSDPMEFAAQLKLL